MITLHEVQRAAYDVAMREPQTVNPRTEHNNCTYFGPNGTTCLAGAIMRELGLPEPTINCSVRVLTSVIEGVLPTGIDLLGKLQYQADNLKNWGDAYHDACQMLDLGMIPAEYDVDD